MTTYLNQSINISSFSDLLTQANTNTQGSFWTGIYWMLVTLFFLSSASVFGWEIAILVAFFGGFVMGLFLLYLDLITMVTFAATEAILLFVTIYLIYSSSKNN